MQGLPRPAGSGGAASASGSGRTPTVPVVCGVGRTIRGVRGTGALSLEPANVAYTSYRANSGDGEEWGDGVCPLRTALLPGAQAVVMEGVWHSPLGGRLWYGSRPVVRYWARYLPGRAAEDTDDASQGLVVPCAATPLGARGPQRAARATA